MASTPNLFALQPLLVALLEQAVGDVAQVFTVYDLARAKGELSPHPAVYLMLEGLSPRESRPNLLHLEQRWEVSISVPVAVADRSGAEALEQIGQLAYRVVVALQSAQLAGVKSVTLTNQSLNAGLVGNRWVIPFLFTAVVMQPVV